MRELNDCMVILKLNKYVCHVRSLGRALELRVKGTGCNHRSGKTCKLCYVDLNAPTRLTSPGIILCINVCK